jgi:hypothetical protein
MTGIVHFDGGQGTARISSLKTVQAATTKFFSASDSSTDLSAKLVEAADGALADVTARLPARNAVHRIEKSVALQAAILAAVSTQVTMLRRSADFLEGVTDVCPDPDLAVSLTPIRLSGSAVQKSTAAATIRRTADALHVEVSVAQDRYEKTVSALAVRKASATAREAEWNEAFATRAALRNLDEIRSIERNMLLAKRQRLADRVEELPPGQRSLAEEELRTFDLRECPELERQLAQRMEIRKEKALLAIRDKEGIVLTRAKAAHAKVQRAHKLKYYVKGAEHE